MGHHQGFENVRGKLYHSLKEAGQRGEESICTSHGPLESRGLQANITRMASAKIGNNKC